MTCYDVCRAYYDARERKYDVLPLVLLSERTGDSSEACKREAHLAADSGLLDYGLFIELGWLTGEGESYMWEALSNPDPA